MILVGCALWWNEEGLVQPPSHYGRHSPLYNQVGGFDNYILCAFVFLVSRPRIIVLSSSENEPAIDTGKSSNLTRHSQPKAQS